MRMTKSVLTGLAALALMASPALAQPGPGWQQGPHGGEMPDHMSNPGGPMRGYMSNPGGPMQGAMPPYYHHHHDGYYRPPPGGWHRGDRFYGPPPGGWPAGNRFYGPPPVVIHNYGYYNLAPPPPGYYWVQTGNQFLMIAIATGIIAGILTAPIR